MPSEIIVDTLECGVQIDDDVSMGKFGRLIVSDMFLISSNHFFFGHRIM